MYGKSPTHYTVFTCCPSHVERTISRYTALHCSIYRSVNAVNAAIIKHCHFDVLQYSLGKMSFPRNVGTYKQTRWVYMPVRS